MRYWILISLLLLGSNSFCQKSIHFNKIIKQLGIERSKCKVNLISSKGNGELGKSIMVIPEIVVESEDYFELNSYIVIIDDKSKEIKSKYFESSTTNEWYSDAKRIAEISIDNYPYYLTDSIRAFGVGVRYVGSSQANPYESHVISFFIEDDERLVPVLKGFKRFSYVGEWDTDCEGFFVIENKSLSMRETQTNGFYDMWKLEQVSETRTELDEFNVCNEDVKSYESRTTLNFENGFYK